MWRDISAVTVDSLTVTGIPCQAWARQVGSRTTYSKKSVRFGPKEGFLRGKMGYCGKEEGSWSGGPRRETKGIDISRKANNCGEPGGNCVARKWGWGEEGKRERDHTCFTCSIPTSI